MSKPPIINGSNDHRGTRLLKDEDVMALFRISQSSLYKWRTKKLIPYFKMGGTNYYLEDIIYKMLYLRGGKLPEYEEDKE